MCYNVSYVLYCVILCYIVSSCIHFLSLYLHLDTFTALRHPSLREHVLSGRGPFRSTPLPGAGGLASTGPLLSQPWGIRPPRTVGRDPTARWLRSGRARTSTFLTPRPRRLRGAHLPPPPARTLGTSPPTGHAPWPWFWATCLPYRGPQGGSAALPWCASRTHSGCATLRRP